MKKMNTDIGLGPLRNEIDRIDRKLITLLNKRGGVSSRIGEIKKEREQSIYAPDRESKVYEGISAKNTGPMKDELIRNIYREIMSACLALEKPLNIAYLGPEFTFTHQAAMKKFGSSVNYLSCDSIGEVFTEVERGNADYGVVPIENSIEGAVNHTMDVFVRSPLVICSEAYLRIRHAFMSKAASLKAVRSIYTHPQVFGQCRGWIEKNFSTAKLKETSSTTKAAEVASKQSKAGCIASELAAARYGLNILASSVEDSASNVTRFLIIGDDMPKPTGRDKTSVVFSVKDRPGILHDSLTPFKKAGINLTKIESRPYKLKAWQYYFFVDMQGHADDLKVRKALRELDSKCDFLKVLGSYPRG
jgi:chorismate mutase/prephenate dehydratase